MALSGLDIYKLLPKTNCKECGVNTCMAFAMKVAAKKAQLSGCPYVSEEGKADFSKTRENQIKQVRFGPGSGVLTGGEKVLYRHEEAFYNKPVISVEVSCKEDINARVKKLLGIKLNILNKEETIDALTVNGEDSSLEDFKKCIEIIYSHKRLPLILKMNREDILDYVIKNLPDDKPLICFDNEDINSYIEKIKESKLPVAAFSEKALQLFIDNGVEDIVIAFTGNYKELDSARKLALKYKKNDLAYPVFVEVHDYLDCASYICRYASIINLPYAEPEFLLSLFNLRDNIYQDPRKPIQVEAKLYEIGNVDASSPVVITTNFSLTYFAVSSEVEASRIPAYLLIVDTGGTSVLSAWASDKINAGKINKALKESGIENKVSHRKMILPGYIYPVKEELDEVSGWESLIGPKEAKDLGLYLKSIQSKV
ncbi:MAG: acetyl-CoA decarbonylase/synthase complex subunit gamma [Armatimonadota bacterium]